MFFKGSSLRVARRLGLSCAQEALRYPREKVEQDKEDPEHGNEEDQKSYVSTVDVRDVVNP
jgi:hypothetical protein